jgi:hypothetical protein
MPALQEILEYFLNWKSLSNYSRKSSIAELKLRNSTFAPLHIIVARHSPVYSHFLLLATPEFFTKRRMKNQDFLTHEGGFCLCSRDFQSPGEVIN